MGRYGGNCNVTPIIIGLASTTSIGIGIAILAVAASAGFLFYKKYKESNIGTDRRKLDMQLVALSQRLRRTPDNVELLAKRGLVCFRKKDYKSALKDMDRVIELDNMNTQGHYHRAVILEAAGDKKAARKEYQWVREHSEDPYFKTAVSDRLKKLR
jgi:tetratricopeptide (TPR) repeat protein